MILRAAKRLHALTVSGTGFVDVSGNRRRADERHRGNPTMIEDGFDGLFVAVDHVEYSVGESCLLKECGHLH